MNFDQLTTLLTNIDEATDGFEGALDALGEARAQVKAERDRFLRSEHKTYSDNIPDAFLARLKEIRDLSDRFSAPGTMNANQRFERIYDLSHGLLNEIKEEVI